MNIGFNQASASPTRRESTNFKKQNETNDLIEMRIE
jgi:hypothetical protein